MLTGRTILKAAVASATLLAAVDASSDNVVASHVAYRLAGSGEWRTPNPDHDAANPASPSQFGIRLRQGASRRHVVGEVFGLTSDGREAVYQSLQIVHDPSNNDIVVEQIGWDGAIARGRQPLRTEPLEPGDVDVLEQLITAPDGTTKTLRHTETVIDDGTFRSVVSEKIDGDWVQRQTWTWTRFDPDACAAGCPILTKEVVVNAPLERVWNAWTTNDGLRFISQKSNVELRPGGPYEWFLDDTPDERGVPGSKGSRVLTFVPEQLLAFAWTFPPPTPNLRKAGETTTVIVVLQPLDDARVQVRLQAVGWRDGDEWRKGWAYFDAAWGSVLGALKRQLETS